MDSGVAPVLHSISGGIVKMTIPAHAEGYPFVIVDLYAADPAALANHKFWPGAMTHPGKLLGSFKDNSAGDLDPAVNELSIDVSKLGVTDTTYLTAAASYSAVEGSFNATDAVTTPLSNPVSAKPTLEISVHPGVDVPDLITELSWLGATDSYDLQSNESVNKATGWSIVPADGTVYTLGRSVSTLGFDPIKPTLFYRLISR